MTHQEIQEILNREDIEGLLATGAPRDEYEHEAKLIGRTIRGCQYAAPVSREMIKEIVARIWRERFGPFSERDLANRESAFERVAVEISALDSGE